MNQKLIIIESPYRAMKDADKNISAESYAEYIQKLISVNFEIIECVSFAQEKAEEILKAINLDSKEVKLAAIADKKSDKKSVLNEKIKNLNYMLNPLEVESWESMKYFLNLNKEVTIWLSINYEEKENILKWIKNLSDSGISKIILEDKSENISENSINELFSFLTYNYPNIEFGADFSSFNWHKKVKSAFDGGCFRFVSALKGLPVGGEKNIPTEKLITFAQANNLSHGLNLLAFESAFNMSMDIFG